MIRLKNSYISVEYESGPSFGGSQRLSRNKIISSVGCGVIAAADLLVYLSRNHQSIGCTYFNKLTDNPVGENNYYCLLTYLKRYYFPLIPRFGMNGLGLMLGMELFFKRYSLPFTCHWCIRDVGIWKKVEAMLRSDIPVIMGVGPNFPFIWKNGKAILYTKNECGEYIPASSVKAHFITICGIDENWLEISSWGKRFYLNRRMYEEYVSKYSAPFVSNILYIKKKPL